MYLIVGLGNPGQQYAHTRHNVGFDVMAVLEKKLGVTISREKGYSQTADCFVDGQKVILALRQTYMNLSGLAVRELMDYYKIPPENVLVIYDDIDIPQGTVRIRPNGSAGTHNGMRSIVAETGTEDFPRIRVGVGQRGLGWNLADWVLSHYQTAEEQEIADGQYTYIVKSLKALNDSGFALIMKSGESTYMAVCNAFGSVKLVDIDGNEVSDDAMAAEAKAYAEANIVSHSDGDLNKVKLLVPDASDVTPISLDGVYNSVTCAYKAEGVGYVFVSRSYGYSNEPMVIYYVIDDNGAIVTMTADELILFKEYFTSYQLDESSYKAGFTGLTGDSFTGDEALISGATVSSDAIRVATEDAFAAFAAVNENGGEIG